MTDKSRFDLDAAFAALERDERTAQPAVSPALQARVLGDAAEISAEITSLQRAAALRRAARRGGGFRIFAWVDAWTGAAAAALVLCLIAGFGTGYEAGPELMAQAGIGDVKVAAAAKHGDGPFLSEDVL